MSELKGVVLAGGLGKRLSPLTHITNKHLLHVFNKPMVYYPIQTLVDAGIRDILIVTGGNHAGEFLRLLGNGREFGLKHINYTYQKGEGGIAEALGLAEHFADNGKVVVILGDNIFEKDINASVDTFRKQDGGARLILKEMDDPQRFGVAAIEDGKLVAIEEKPKRPKSRYVVTGIYMYDSRVFQIIRGLRPSARGELEISDVNNKYIEWGDVAYDFLDGEWTDCGTFDSLLHANNLVAKRMASRG